MQGAEGVWEMTWSFSGPHGRATFEFTRIDGEFAIRWRRIGLHVIYSNHDHALRAKSRASWV